MTNADEDLRALLEALDPKARDDLRRVLIRDQPASRFDACSLVMASSTPRLI